MKRKKFLAMLMALAMMFSLCVGALADDPAPAPSNDFQGTATVTVPTIAVTVANSASLFINPMGFKVKLNGTAAAVTDADADTTTSKIVSPVNLIVNNSPMDLSVSVIGSVAPKEGNVALAITPTPIAADDTKNSVFIFTRFGKITHTSDNTDTTDVNEESNVFTSSQVAYAAANDPSAADYDETGAADKVTLALTTKAPTTPIVVGDVVKATVTGTGADAVTTPGYFGFQFLGDCNPKAKNAWNSGDEVTVNLAFTFKPV